MLPPNLTFSRNSTKTYKHMYVCMFPFCYNSKFDLFLLGVLDFEFYSKSQNVFTFVLFCLLWEIFVTYFDMTFLYIFLLDIWHRDCGRNSKFRHYTDTKTVGVHWWLAKISVWDDIQLDSIWPNPLLFVCPVVYPFANDPWRLKHTL